LTPTSRTPSAGEQDTCVAYLIDSLYRREGADLGLAPVARFLESYVTHDAGASHRLLVMRRGFRSAQAWAPHASEFEKRGVTYKALDVLDTGYDLGAYGQAVESSTADAYCFLNTSSEVLCDGWLAHLHNAAHTRAAGLVGATGSFESAYSYQLSAYHTARRSGDALASVRYWIGARRRRRQFDAFPNPHIRTSGFMLRRSIAVRLQWRPPRTRSDALRCESGRSGLSSQARALGLRNLIVGCDGRAYEQDEWASSGTFRCGEQSNLLIADNRTRQYQAGSMEERIRLAQLAWGDGRHA